MSSQQFQLGASTILVLGGQTDKAYSPGNFSVAFAYIPTMTTAQVDMLEMNTTATTLPTSGGTWSVTVLFTDPPTFNAFVSWKDQTLAELVRLSTMNATSSKKLSDLMTTATITLYQNVGTVPEPSLVVAAQYKLSGVQISGVSALALAWGGTATTMSYTITFSITGVVPA